MGFNSFRDLVVWQRAMDLAQSCYEETKSFPRTETFGMTSQIRRAAASVPANIAEGHGREQTGVFIQFLRTAQGSLKELETHLLLCERVALLGGEASAALLRKSEEVGKMLRSLIRSLEQKQKS